LEGNWGAYISHRALRGAEWRAVYLGLHKKIGRFFFWKIKTVSARNQKVRQLVVRADHASAGEPNRAFQVVVDDRGRTRCKGVFYKSRVDERRRWRGRERDMMKTKTLKKNLRQNWGRLAPQALWMVPNARGRGSAFSIDQQQREHVGRPPWCGARGSCGFQWGDRHRRGASSRRPCVDGWGH